ncbi:NAD(P)H-binding protein [Winogradskyella sp. UBA3174]|uniref:NAD(P)H-binding protein n=1 Tax=Winogradskyella sp. UBA3174 TaxID=1947785 RepID=UPI0025F6DC97|nr:NAD(P)H-binding protein [Winogradskyella sp. UBA3174]
MKDQISIIGCGWLGFPLAKALINEGFSIKGSTTSMDKLSTLKSNGIDPFLIELDEDKLIGNYSKFLQGSTTIIINIPPGLRKSPNKNHSAELIHLINAIEKSSIKNVLFISSISVYQDDFNFSKITEDLLPNTNSNNGKQLIEIEESLRENAKFKTTILRFGGLFDDKRHPAKYLSGKTNIANPEAPINLIHKQDCIEIIAMLLRKNTWNISINATYPAHPTKKGYYSEYCLKADLALPKFNKAKKSKGKIIDSSILVQNLKYTFKQAP